MTFEQFKEHYSTIEDLYSFMNDNDIYLDDNYLYHRDDAMNEIDDDVIECIRSNGLEDTVGYINRINFDYEFYIHGEMNDWDWDNAEDYYDDIAEFVYDVADDAGYLEDDNGDNINTEPIQSDFDEYIRSETEEEDVPLMQMIFVDKTTGSTSIGKFEKTSEEDDAIALQMLVGMN